MSTLRVNTLQDATGSNQPAMVGAAKAWVNFDGTGTVAIRESFNVSSITDTGVGNYTVNFTTAMPDANYAIFLSIRRTTDWGEQGTAQGSSYTTNFLFAVRDEVGTAYDTDAAYAVVFR